MKGGDLQEPNQVQPGGLSHLMPLHIHSLHHASAVLLALLQRHIGHPIVEHLLPCPFQIQVALEGCWPGAGRGRVRGGCWVLGGAEKTFVSEGRGEQRRTGHMHTFDTWQGNHGQTPNSLLSSGASPNRNTNTHARAHTGRECKIQRADVAFQATGGNPLTSPTPSVDH